MVGLAEGVQGCEYWCRICRLLLGRVYEEAGGHVPVEKASDYELDRGLIARLREDDVEEPPSAKQVLSAKVRHIVRYPRSGYSKHEDGHEGGRGYLIGVSDLRSHHAQGSVALFEAECRVGG